MFRPTFSSINLSVLSVGRTIALRLTHIDGFTSFNEFFTRQVKRVLRPVSDVENEIVAPADGYVWVEKLNSVASRDNFNLKGDVLSPEELLGYDDIWRSFVNGTAVINFLAATDYHRFWSPVDGKVVKLIDLGGLYV